MNKIFMNNNFMLNAIAAINKCAPYATGKTGYAMLKARNTFQSELAPFEEARQNVFERYGTKNDKGEWVVVKDGNEENFEKFNNELVDLLNIGEEISIYTIPEEDFSLNFEGDVSLYDYDLIHSIIVEKVPVKEEATEDGE